MNILHLTDIHFGQAGMDARWPTVRAQFLSDLDYVINKSGPIDLIALTGDIANKAIEGEYGLATAFLEDLGLWLLERTDKFPSVAVVPGNHDVARPLKPSAEQTVLEQAWNYETQAAFMADSDFYLRPFVSDLFANYQNWLRDQPLPLVDSSYTGILPGEFSATLVENGMRIGILGLNSAFRHISDRATAGSLTLTAEQAQFACGGDLPKWSSQHDVCIVLTHHPMSWIAGADSTVDSLFNEVTNVRLHLCGHLHEQKYSLAALGSTASYLTHQGLSLFGLENYGKSDERRRHGYAVLTLTMDDLEVDLKVWPREAVRTGSGVWSIDRSSTFGLARDASASKAVKIVERSSKAPNKAERGLHSTPISRHPANETSTLGHPADDTATVEAAFLADLSSGEMVAIVGDRQVDVLGTQKLAVREFRAVLWEQLGAGIPDDGITTLEQLLMIIADRDPKKARELVGEHFGWPTESSLAEMRRLLDAPWSALIYMSPLRDLDEVHKEASSKNALYMLVDGTEEPFSLPEPFAKPALRLAAAVPPQGSLQLRLPTDLSLQDRENSSADWTQFARQLLARSRTVFLTDDVVSLNFWKWISDRGTSPSKYKPTSYLVCPNLPPQYAAILARYDVYWIRKSVHLFIESMLQPSRAQVAEGLYRQRRRRSASQRSNIGIDSLMQKSPAGSRKFLLGASPTWGDIRDGFTIPLASQQQLVAKIEKADPGTVHVVTGTAGSGRSTALMQCALEVSNNGRQVAWVDSATIGRIGDIVEDIINDAAEVIFIDDVDVFGAEAAHLIDELRGSADHRRVVIAGVRTVREHLIEVMPFTTRQTLGDLIASDIKSLVHLLREHLAVANKRLSDAEVERLLLENAAGQLLVGMIQATSGVPFTQRIASECAQLSDMALYIYGCISLVSAEREGMTIDQALAAATIGAHGSDPKTAWREFNRLLSADLIRLIPGTGRYRVRHDLIAEEVRAYTAKNGLLAGILKGTLRAFSAAAAKSRDSSQPARRTLIRLLSHSYLIGLQLPPSVTRSVYDSVEDLLQDDFNYWLQRGSFEVEKGEDNLAMHDLTAAMTTPGGEKHHNVLTEFSYLRLRVARRISSIEATKMGMDAINDLHTVILHRGAASPHAYVVLAQQGVDWLRLAPIGATQQRELAEESRRLLDLAKALDESNPRVARYRGPAVAALDRLLLETGG
ncbi:metallophosphoesterase [Jatrophihabitans sp.]|uniref:P-loop NTPase n=1 Tax=Jatrophihabitans sp. TaxID=1932789 RepID=UPI002BB7B3CC|nr:metallophosphoesterase [Jatrophihabitans sp.]